MKNKKIHRASQKRTPQRTSTSRRFFEYYENRSTFPEENDAIPIWIYLVFIQVICTTLVFIFGGPISGFLMIVALVLIVEGKDRIVQKIKENLSGLSEES